MNNAYFQILFYTQDQNGLRRKLNQKLFFLHVLFSGSCSSQDATRNCLYSFQQSVDLDFRESPFLLFDTPMLEKTCQFYSALETCLSAFSDFPYCSEDRAYFETLQSVWGSFCSFLPQDQGYSCEIGFENIRREPTAAACVQRQVAAISACGIFDNIQNILVCIGPILNQKCGTAAMKPLETVEFNFERRTIDLCGKMPCTSEKKEMYLQCFTRMTGYAPILGDLKLENPLAPSPYSRDVLMEMCHAYENFMVCTNGIDHCKTDDPTHRFLRSILGLICTKSLRDTYSNHRECLDAFYQSNNTQVQLCFEDFGRNFQIALDLLFSEQETQGLLWFFCFNWPKS